MLKQRAADTSLPWCEEDVEKGNIRGENRKKLKIIGRVEDGGGGIFTEGVVLVEA